MYATDTIAAIATAPGAGGIGIVRVSGSLSANVAAAVFSPAQRNGTWRSHHLYHGAIVGADGAVLDDALAVLMRAPHSYTGEDVLELHCHGSPAVLRRVLARVLSCGTRLADKGEFTKRAFLNGRLDLAQAEAVIDLVRARSATAASVAADQLAGNLSRHLHELRAAIVRVKALLETQIDFSEEDVHIDTTDIISNIDTCIGYCSRLIDTYNYGKLVRDGVRVAIIGKPNVGKSSLLNALLGEDRAIVTAIPGTTRDALDETADFDGVPVVLSDTAGLRTPHAADPVERLGMERTSRKIDDAEMVAIVVDAAQPLDDEDTAALAAAGERPHLIVLNKIDLPPAVSEAALGCFADGRAIVRVSALQGVGLSELRRTVVEQIGQCPPVDRGGAVVTSVRHVDALAKALASLELARQSLADGRPPDLVAVDVQDALDHVGTITGAVTSEDVLDRIFSEFCIGK